jgi:hypothetical protein
MHHHTRALHHHDYDGEDAEEHNSREVYTEVKSPG